MQISAIPSQQTNFSSNMRILKVLTMGKNGQEPALRPVHELQGPLYAFVKRLNNQPDAPETLFFSRCFSQFRKYPFVSSTNMATIDRYLIFGKQDIYTFRELCTSHYHKKELSKEEVIKQILDFLIRPFNKKYRYAQYKGDKTGEPVCLVLHANKVKNPKGKGKIYNFGIDVRNESGSHVYAVLPSQVPEVAKLQPEIRLPKLEQGEFKF